MLEKLINWGRKSTSLWQNTHKQHRAASDIGFGRYSDNNKTPAKAARWAAADDHFKNNKPYESMDAFFDYLKDDAVNNVNYHRSGETAEFSFFQGSKTVRGKVQNGQLSASVQLARMAHSSAPVMRRLLEMNFGLYYGRFALSDSELCMRFDTSVDTANPNKLYYGLKELATKSDKQDDLLMDDFAALEPLDHEHITEIPAEEKQVKFEFMHSWIKETLEKVASVDANNFSGGIGYLLLTLAYRIDFLIVPEGSLLNDLEKISAIYFKNDERPMMEKNRDMTDAFKKLLDKPKEEVFKNLFRSKHTFSIVAPPAGKAVAEAIEESNKNMQWYRVNNYPFFANKVTEYGLSYCQFTYSLPRPVTELFELFMRINYADYFLALGQKDGLYQASSNSFHQGNIHNRIQKIIGVWKKKYPKIAFHTAQLNYENLVSFNESFTKQVQQMNLES